MNLPLYFGIIVLMHIIRENECEPLALTVSPKDTTLFYFQNSTLDCIFNRKVDCVWKKDGLIVTMDDYKNYISYENGKNAMSCSINLYTVNNNHTGIWTCQNDISESNASLVTATAIVRTQECGNAASGNEIEAKIAGGEETTANKYPWIVTIHNKSKNSNYPLYVTLLCHGTLISRKWILTDAGCAFQDETTGILKSLKELRVSLGRSQLYSTFTSMLNPWRDVCDIIVHPQFDIEYSDYSLALMKLTTSVEFSAVITPICLPPSGINYDDSAKHGIIAGFGETEEFVRSPLLMEITVPVISAYDCWRVWNSRSIYVSSRMICAGDLGGKKVPCHDDFGTALMYKYYQKNQTSRFVVIGIESSVHRTCPSSESPQPNAPGIFIKVDEFLEFINSYIHNDECPTLEF